MLNLNFNVVSNECNYFNFYLKPFLFSPCASCAQVFPAVPSAPFRAIQRLKTKLYANDTLTQSWLFSNWWVRGLWRFSPLWRKGKRCKRESAHRRMSLTCSLHPACCRKGEEEKGRRVLVLQPVLTSSASVNAVIHMACMRLLWKDQSASRTYTLQCYSGALLNKQQCWFHQSVKVVVSCYSDICHFYGFM